MTPAIAIVGMACRYPDAARPEALWELVLARRRAFRRMPSERLRLADFAARDEHDADSIYPIEVAVLEDYRFDATRFRIPVASVAAADLTHWLALDVATGALADAGVLSGGQTADRLDRGRTGVVVGNTLTGEFSRAGLMRLRWPYVRRQLDAALAGEGFDAARRAGFLQQFEATYKAPFPPPDEEMLAGGLSNTIAGRICNYYDLHGGGFTVDGACASSLLAVADACRMLEANEADAMLAGGVDLSLDPFELVGFARNGALSKSVMRVFDARADGFWPGEGCGFVVLMRESDARASGLPVRALIRGWGISTDGAGGLTRPTVAGQRAALERAYARAGFGAGTVPLFEAHGTGTAVGDPIEVAAIAEARRAAGIEVPAVIGSIKANIGHTKAAAGMAALIKAVLALEHRVLPAATACGQVHPAILEQQDAVTVPAESRVWPEQWKLRAGVSGMGFGGINLHVALEGVAAPRPGGFDAVERRLLAAEQDAELFLFAADDRAELHRQVSALAASAPHLSGAELADAAAALAARLGDGRERAMVVAATPAELADRLGLLLDRFDRPGIDAGTGIGLAQVAASPRIAFLFPGQAARVRLDGGAWRRRFAGVAELYRVADLPSDADPTATEVAQPAIMTAALAGLAVLDRLGIEASVAIGHSVGELAALHWAGAFDAAVLLRLARGRGRAMAEQSLPGGTMALINASPELTAKLLPGADVAVACRNAAAECVIAGAAADVDIVLARAQAAGVTAQKLAVSHAFHSRFVAPATAAVHALLAAEAMVPLRRRVISTITGSALPTNAGLVELLAQQLTAPVRFAEALAVAASEADLLIEVGPGHGLTRIAVARGDQLCVALDAGGPSLFGLLTAAGTAFLLGAPLRVGALFADRFVREFDLDRPRRFLANPCEAAPADAAPPARARQSRAVAKAAIAVTAATPMEAVRGLLARRLELDPATIEPEHRLLGDLHLNSIAVGQIVGEAARLLGRMPPPTPTNFAQATVRQVADALQTVSLLPDAVQASTRFPPGAASWIRRFATQERERPLARAGEPPPGWQVFAPPAHKLAGRLSPACRLADKSAAAVAICLPAHPGAEHLPLLLAGAQAAVARGALLLVAQQGIGGAAFARCLALEHPQLAVRVVELPFDHPDAADWIAAEAAGAAAGYAEARYDLRGTRWQRVLRVLPQAAHAQGARLGTADVLLVSGGAKGIGAECALALARHTGARLALVGRSRADRTAVTATMARLRAAGVTADYAAADVTDAAAVAAAVARLQRGLGPVTGVVHAAGINRPLPVMRLDAATMAETVAVKVAGLGNLLAAVAPERLRLLAGFGSIIARIGLPGEAHYALANEWMGRLIEDFSCRHPACRALVAEWSVWSGIGMGENLGAVDSLERLGVAALPPEAATAEFIALVETAVQPCSVVVAGRFGEPPTVDLHKPALPASRFLQRVPVFYPGVELVAEATLSPASDPYLDDHALDGTPLFPAVLGLEAMVQAAAMLAGAAPDTLDEVSFARPVPTRADGGLLRIAALRGGDGRVEIVLRSDETGFQTDHFRAVAHIAGAMEPAVLELPAGKLALDPSDLYGRLLFHGGRFRRVAGYAALSATQCIARLHPGDGERWFPGLESDALLLGDPGVRDAALHALQACIPHRRVLPVAVRRIRLGHLAAGRAYAVHATETARDGDRFTFDLSISGGDGTVVEQWDGLTLQAIEPIAAPACWPLPLAAPFIERRLAELLPGGGLHVTIAASASSDAVLGSLLGARDALRRRPDGKPEAGIGVSAAHAGAITLGVVADAAIGCDIEPVSPRSADAWGDLLGPERLALARLISRDLAADFDHAATRVWAAVEALKKAGAAVTHSPLSLRLVDADWLVLRSGAFEVAVWAGVLGQECVAVAVAKGGMAASGERDRPAYAYRHVVGFGDTNLVGNVYFVNYVEWQGRCREMFLRDKAPSVLPQLADGLALVTTRCSCDYRAELAAFDEVRLDMRLAGIAGNRIAFSFEYWRCGGAAEELVAVGEQEVACLATVAGRKVATEVPAALAEALRPYAA